MLAHLKNSKTRLSIYPFSTILIANRGEIARRVIRACRRLGIRAAAVYSDADAGSAHVAEADIAVRIGPAPAADSYLNADAILAAARHAGADAIHPGYGFLAENAAFARACAAAGLIFIGPSPEAIATMGDKRAARALAEQIGAPVVPGDHGEAQDDDALAAAAAQIGYPVMVKAAAGGGGKGMRLVREAAALPAALAEARREAVAAFGRGDLLLERALARPRHVEVQVLGDQQRHLIHLGERDCSIQRRHQKIIEEAPAPGLSAATRAALGDTAVRLAAAVGYSGAGTVEFLLDGEQFYFLEMNTRLQVEHSVTELVTGIDLVEWQIRVAAGEALPWRQEDVRLRGHAIEARLYAEDPAHDFLPVTGPVLLWRLPAVVGGTSSSTSPSTAAVRVDDGIRTGDAVTVHYDPLLAKIIAHSENRAAAVEHLSRAIAGTTLLGLTTNLGFLGDVLAHPAFVAGDVTTHFLEEHTVTRTRAADPTALIAAALARRQADAAGGPGAWRNNPGEPAPTCFRAAGEEVRLWLSPEKFTPDCFTARLSLDPATTYAVRLEAYAPPDMALTIDGAPQSVELVAQGDVWWAHTAGGVSRLEALPLLPEPRRAAGGGSLRAPLPGVVRAVLVAPGQRVVAEEPLLKLEAMKMEYTIRAPADGIVAAVHFAPGDSVAADDLLVQLAEQE